MSLHSILLRIEILFCQSTTDFSGPLKPTAHSQLFRYNYVNFAGGLTAVMGSRWQLLLPKTKFPLRVNAVTHEPVIQRAARFDDLYKWQQWNNGAKNRPSFTLHDGPPYANGEPHMGHALNKILKDIINRYKVMNGHRVHYRPGWDCHGLPIELKACKGMTISKQKQARKIRETAGVFARETMKIQAEVFKRWGVMGDWDNPYVTMNKDYEANQLRVFYEMYKRGCIYRSFKPVYWSPSSHTALAEAELEYQEHHSHSVYVLFPTCLPPTLSHFGDVYALVWTTTPWTLPANRAICYHPEHKYSLVHHLESGRVVLVGTNRLNDLQNVLGRFEIISNSILGSCLAGATYSIPIYSNKYNLPFLPGDHVNCDEGTGLVHTAPAHGFDDYVVGIKHGLDLRCMVDEQGYYTIDAGENLVGLQVLNTGSDTVVSQLKASDHLLHESSYAHRYPYDWRTKKPVITRSTQQWFACVEMLKQSALSAIHHVATVPAGGAKLLANMIDQRSDWCISRQRVWGVPIPVFFLKAQENEVLLNDEVFEHVVKLIQSHGSDCWWHLSVEQLLPASHRDKAGEYVKGADTMDVWFDSGTSWATALQDQGGQADLYLEGKDQYRGWFQSSLLTSLAAQQKAPYKQLVTHGFVLDEKGIKMSKSVGNVISPSDILTKWQYGADVMRLWVASSSYTSDVSISKNGFAQTNDVLQKVRNTLRFMLGNLSDFKSADHLLPYSKLSPTDQYLLHCLFQFINTSAAAYESFVYSRIYNGLISFVPEDLSALYFDVAKDTLYCEPVDSKQRRRIQTVLHHLLLHLTSSLAPILPHLAEEVVQYYPFEQGTYI